MNALGDWSAPTVDPKLDDPGTPLWMIDLEAAHDALRRASRLLVENAQPAIDLRPPARALERAFGSVYDAFDERAPRLDATRSAIASLDDALVLLSPAASLDAAVGFALELLTEARKSLLFAVERLETLFSRTLRAVGDLHASLDLPVLHALDRPSLTPRLNVPAPPPEVEPRPSVAARPTTFEELAKAVEALGRRPERREAAVERPTKESRGRGEVLENRPGFVARIAPAVTAEAFLRSRVRHCFEEVSMIGIQRAPLLGDPWRASLALERRMLAAVDAIVAMGPASVAAVESIVMDAPAKDAAHVFGAAMIMGCLTGRDALAAAERVFIAFELGDPEAAAGFAGALKLVPHPSLPLVMRTWLADPDPARRAVAIDVLGYRRLANADELARAAVDEPGVAAAALPHYARTRGPGVADALSAALASSTLALRQSAWLAMALTADPRAPGVLRAEMAGDNAVHAALPLAIVGDAKDASELLERAFATRSKAFITAVGWAGAATAIPSLIALLQVLADDELKLAVAYALDRITGAGLVERTLVPPDQVMVPDVAEPALPGEIAPQPKHLAALVSDPRDLPGDGAPDTLDQPTVDPARWLAFWKERETHFDPKGRFRRGWLYTPLVSLREIDRWRCTPGERRTLQRELAARAGAWVHFDPHDFVVVQERSIEEWEPVARHASGQPGAWTWPAARRP